MVYRSKDELRGTTAASFVENWLRRDSFRAGQAAIDLMNAFGPGPESDSIASQVVQHLASKNELESASEWIANISNESLRVSLMRDFGIRRSEERRVGKECRSRWSPDHSKKKKRKKSTIIQCESQ